MSKDSGRHARSKSDWDTQPSRSAERREAAAEPDRQAPGRKDRRAQCKKNGGGPHIPAIVFIAPVFDSYSTCEWVPHWSRRKRSYNGTGWSCRHEERCSCCGRVLRMVVVPSECPAFPGDPVQRAAAEIDAVCAQERQDTWRGRRKVISGPQGYRRRRTEAPGRP